MALRFCSNLKEYSLFYFAWQYFRANTLWIANFINMSGFDYISEKYIRIAMFYVLLI